jgi:PhnB protein
MKLSIHLTFSGQCEEAFRFYERCFGGSIVTMLTYGDSPMAAETPVEWQGKILHATLTFGENVLAGVDLLPKDQAKPQGFFALLDIDDIAEAERIFHTLSENGIVRMPMQETFWARRFAALVDRFGIPWEINCGRPT